MHVDIRSPDSVRAMYHQVGSFDALVCAAGDAHLGPFDSMSEAEFALGIESKLLGQIRLVLLGRSLISDGGSFTLVSGYLLDDPIPVGAGFSVANGGVEGFVRSAALSLDRGVRINAVSPGLAEDSDEQFARFNPGRIPVPMPTIGAAFVRSDADLEDGADEHQRGDTAVTHGGLQRRADERGHTELVEHRLPGDGGESSTMAVCAASGGNALVTSCAWSLRCHAIAVRRAPTPRWVGGRETCRT